MSNWTDHFPVLEAPPVESESIVNVESDMTFYKDNPVFTMHSSVHVVEKAPLPLFPDVYRYDENASMFLLSFCAVVMKLGILENGNYVYVLEMIDRYNQKAVFGFDALIDVKMCLEIIGKLFSFNFKIKFPNDHDMAIFLPYVHSFIDFNGKRPVGVVRPVLHIDFDIHKIDTCCACFEPFSFNNCVPLILKCACTICKNCVVSIIERSGNKEIECPFCHVITPEVKTSRLIINYKVLD